MNSNKIYSYLGLAMRGRNLVSGEVQTIASVKEGSAMLVIIAEDASDNTRKKFMDKCSFYEVPVITFGDMDSLGRAIGKDLRSVCGVCDAGLADAIMKQFGESNSHIERNGGKHGEN